MYTKLKVTIITDRCLTCICLNPSTALYAY